MFDHKKIVGFIYVKVRRTKRETWVLKQMIVDEESAKILGPRCLREPKLTRKQKELDPYLPGIHRRNILNVLVARDLAGGGEHEVIGDHRCSWTVELKTTPRKVRAG
jgi:hypothetical protein